MGVGEFSAAPEIAFSSSRPWAKCGNGSGWTSADLARYEGYSDGSEVLVVIKQLEAGMKKNPVFAEKRNQLQHDLSSVVG